MTNEEIEKALTDRAYQVSYVNGDMNKGYFIKSKDKLSQETLSYIDRLKEACNSAIQSFTRMETLYKVKCTELECAKDQTRKETAEKILTALCEPLDVWTETEDSEKSKQRKIGGLLFVKKANERIKEIAKRYGVEVDE